eukprot:818031-Amorphochlora_amoeboformis.AAC.1
MAAAAVSAFDVPPRTPRTPLHRRRHFSLYAPSTPSSSRFGERRTAFEGKEVSGITSTNPSTPTHESSSKITFSTVYSDPVGFRYFLSHMRRTHANENIEFERYVERFRAVFTSGDMKKAHSIAKFIRERFLTEDKDLGSGFLNFSGADKESEPLHTPVNINGSTRNSILSALDKNRLSAELFDAAQRQVIKLIRQDCFPRFKRSHEFTRYLKAAGARKKLALASNSSLSSESSVMSAQWQGEVEWQGEASGIEMEFE